MPLRPRRLQRSSKCVPLWRMTSGRGLIPTERRVVEVRQIVPASPCGSFGAGFAVAASGWDQGRAIPKSWLLLVRCKASHTTLWRHFVGGGRATRPEDPTAHAPHDVRPRSVGGRLPLGMIPRRCRATVAVAARGSAHPGSLFGVSWPCDSPLYTLLVGRTAHAPHDVRPRSVGGRFALGDGPEALPRHRRRRCP